MRLNGSSIRADTTTYWVTDGEITLLDPIRAEVHGEFMLQGGAQIARGHNGLTLIVDFPLEIRRLAQVRKSDGSQRYRFVATGDPDVLAALDVMMNPVAKMPTVLEEFLEDQLFEPKKS